MESSHNITLCGLSLTLKVQESVGHIAQLVEHPAFNRIVVGSSPTVPT